jgi:glycosyltransferase involved in cell wall biosynthesis
VAWSSLTIAADVEGPLTDEPRTAATLGGHEGRDVPHATPLPAAPDDGLPSQKVLIFAYYFPPLGGSSVQRTLKYVKYLPGHGFQPLVVTGRPRWFSQLSDQALLREIPPSAVVVQAPTIPFDYVQGKLDGLLRRVGISSRLVRGSLWPDELVGWVPAAVWLARRLIREHHPSILYSTSLPATSHLAALIVHRLTGLPWVADFRDALTYDPDPMSTRYHPPRFVHAGLERRVVQEATFTTVACDSIDLFGLGRDDRRRQLIPNGVDLQDIASDVGPSIVPTDRFRLSYVGTLYGDRNAGPVFDAVRALAKKGVIDPARFEIRIVGNAVSAAAENLGVPVTFTGFVDHHAAVSEMLNSTALIFHAPSHVPGASGKIYEYLTSGRPVLCVANPNNAAYRLVEELGAGECADVRDPTSVEAALTRLLVRWQDGGVPPLEDVRREAIRRFSRAKLAGDLAELLRMALRENGVPLGAGATS